MWLSANGGIRIVALGVAASAWLATGEKRKAKNKIFCENTRENDQQ